MKGEERGAAFKRLMRSLRTKPTWAEMQIRSMPESDGFSDGTRNIATWQSMVRVVWQGVGG